MVAAEVTYNNAWYTIGGVLSRKETTSKTYTPFGEQIGVKTSGFGYNSEYFSAETGQVYLRARFYEPEMNRFSQKDNQRFVTNEYMYCYNNPVMFVDMDGEEAIVISGGDYKNKNEDPENENLNSYNFISTALRELKLIQEKNIDDHVTWIISESGWSDADKVMFQQAIDCTSVEIVYITSADQLTSYINTQNIDTINNKKYPLIH